MAKKSKYDLLHEQRVNEITKKIDDIYAAAVTEAASIGAIVRASIRTRCSLFRTTR